MRASAKSVAERCGSEWVDRLLVAASDGDLVSVKHILDLGCGLDQANGEGHTALIKACGFGRLAVVDYLIASGCDVDAPCTTQGRTPLMRGVEAFGSELDFTISKRNRSIEKLFKTGCDLSAVTSEGLMAEDVARNNGWLEWAGRIQSERERREIGAVADAGRSCLESVTKKVLA